MTRASKMVMLACAALALVANGPAVASAEKRVMPIRALLDAGADGAPRLLRRGGGGRPSGMQRRPRGGGRPGPGGIGNNITYHGGPIMNATTNVYYIYYGDWSASAAPVILEDFASSVGGSPWYNISTTYWQRVPRAGARNASSLTGVNCTNSSVINSVAFGGKTSDPYSQGTSVSDAGFKAIVTRAITNGLPLDANGVYFVLTSVDTTAASGFCTSYCGWHNNFNVSGVAVKYAFVGHTDRCPDACSPGTVSPNGNAAADAMVNLIAHELVETVTDPLGNAWYDDAGNENADKCAWNFNVTYTAANGGTANVRLGARDYYIQSNWVNRPRGSCALKFP